MSHLELTTTITGLTSLDQYGSPTTTTGQTPLVVYYSASTEANSSVNYCKESRHYSFTFWNNASSAKAIKILNVSTTLKTALGSAGVEIRYDGVVVKSKLSTSFPTGFVNESTGAHTTNFGAGERHILEIFGDPAFLELNGSFSGCTALEYVSITNGPISIGNDTFSGCIGLVKAFLPDSVSVIGARAFDGCTSLKNVRFGTGLTSITSYAFRNCTDMGPIWFTNSYNLTIGSYAFSNCGASEIHFGEHVSTISAYAFQNARVLKLTLPGSSLRTIGSNAFDGCTGLTSLNIENGITSIPLRCFRGCTSLKKVYIPDSVTSIGREAFASCSSVDEIFVGNGNPTIGSYAFSGCTAATEVTVRSGSFVRDSNTANASFLNCSSVSKLTLLGGLSNISVSTFSGLASLKECNIPGSCTYVGDNSSDVVIEGSGSTGMRGSWAFEACPNLERVNVCEGVKEIGFGFLGNSTKVSHVWLPSTLEKISARTLYRTNVGVSYLTGTTYSFNGTIEKIAGWVTKERFDWVHPQQKIVCMDGVYYPYAFKLLVDVQSTTSLTRISNSAINIPATWCKVVGGTNVATIQSAYTFTSIGENVVLFGTNKTSDSYTGTEVAIGQFARTSSLLEVQLPEDCQSIETDAFTSCYNLRKVIIPNSVTSIRNKAFKDCKSLERLAIPDSVTNLEYSPFSGSGIEIIDFGNNSGRTIPTVSTTLLNGVSTTCKIAVPDALVSTWKTTGNWSSFAGRIFSYTTIHEDPFNDGFRQFNVKIE